MRSGATSLAFAPLLVALVGACHSFVPDTRTPTDMARSLEPKCRVVGDDEAIASAANVESVEPSYARVLGGPNAAEARLRGARIHLRTVVGATRERITRSLECHEARVTLGLEPPTENDPYVLPDRWLSIDVASVGDGFVAIVEADELADARIVLDRARRYAGRRAAQR
jgi:hypothetical protein